MTELVLILAGVVVGIGVLFVFQRLLGRKARPQLLQTHTVFEQVRSVGRLVGMEVRAKEIATSTKGFSWLPPAILSQARVAMIFQFEKQFSVDLSRLTRDDVRETAPGRFRLTIPAIEGTLRLLDVTPYDIQAGRVLGLLDIIQVDAATQGDLMKKAQAQASELYTAHDARYEADARRSVERRLRSFLALFDVQADIEWAQEDSNPPPASASKPSPGRPRRGAARELSAAGA